MTSNSRCLRDDGAPSVTRCALTMMRGLGPAMLACSAAADGSLEWRRRARITLALRPAEAALHAAVDSTLAACGGSAAQHQHLYTQLQRFGLGVDDLPPLAAMS